MRTEKAIWLGVVGATLALAAALTARSSPGLVANHSDPPPKHAVRDLKITILSTMLAEEGIGEWGFAALIEVDKKKILFDTGRFPETVARNAKALKISLADVNEVILSHHHGDHTGGLLTLRDHERTEHRSALATAHVGKGFFYSRRSSNGEREENPMISARAEFERGGGEFVEHDAPVELAPGVWLTGPVPRPHAEKNYPAGGKVTTPSGVQEDNLPEDQSLIIDTDKGLVVLSGCGHAGIINTLEYARRVVRNAHIHAAIGGFHLYDASDVAIAWTADELASMGLENFFGAHCTGLEPTYRMRTLIGLAREHSEVAAVGSYFSLKGGIHPLKLAR
jgi:7,8-dihydropterin-6-yl-methyl-4-(beta-D-ribofuranosyl)aminobenzene 5'-phosphate synthase